MDTPRIFPARPAAALLWREWRDDWLFVLAAAGATTGASLWLNMPVVVAAMVCGLILGVRAYAPDSASGTRRFLAALPVSGGTVLLVKLTLRVATVLAGTLLGLAVGGGGKALAVGPGVFYACLVGILAGQTLDRATTAFAAGGIVLVLLARGILPFLLATGTGYEWPRVGAVLLLCLSAGIFAVLSLWLADRR